MSKNETFKKKSISDFSFVCNVFMWLSDCGAISDPVSLGRSEHLS